MLDGEVGGTRGGQGPGSEFDIRELPGEAQARACAWFQSCLSHELLGHTGATNVDHGARSLALGLGGLAQHGKQRISFHPALIPPEAQADLAARTHYTPRLTQGIETIPPDASE